MYDCTDHSEHELSMVISNDEFLYRRRHMLTPATLMELGVKFTDEQWLIFQQDLAEELEEE